MPTRRMFLGSILAAPAISARPPQIQRRLFPEDFHIELELLDPVGDIWFGEERTDDGFELWIYDTSNKAIYTGRVRWWALPSEGASLADAYICGDAVAIDTNEENADGGLVRVTLPKYLPPSPQTKEGGR